MGHSDSQLLAKTVVRNKGIDVLRALLILYIVTLVHGAFWLQIVESPLRSLGLFEMPAIFLLAGFTYALTSSPVPQSIVSGSYVRYCITRATRLLVPYWCYALVCFVIAATLSPRPFAFGTAIVSLLTWLNPLHYGKGHSVSMLNSHLWFITPFLCVTVMFPLLQHAQRALGRVRIELAWLVMAVLLGCLSFVQVLLDGRLALPKTIVFYAAWAALGYAMGVGYRLPTRSAIVLLAASLGLLILAGTFGHPVIDMQKNKFPPNELFFLFGTIWIVGFVLLINKLPAGLADRLYDAWWLKPFRTAGYSIYMWQGVGYAVANMVGLAYGWHRMGVWCVAMALTIALGIAAAPLEKIRFR